MMAVKILKTLLIISIAVFVIDRSLAYALSIIYERTNAGQTGGKLNYFLNQKQVPDLLIMGNSRTYYVLNPDSFKTISSFNLAHAGMSQCFQTALLDIVISHHKTPKKILLQIEPADFVSFYPYKDRITNDAQQLKYFYGSDTLVTTYINSLNPFEFLKYQLHLYKYNGRFVNLILNFGKTLQDPNETGNGYVSIPPSDLDSLHTEYTALNEPPDTSVGKVSPKAAAYLNTFIQLCKANHIELSFYTAPFYYKVNMHRFEPGFAFIDSVATANNFKYVNYAVMPPADKRFYDPSFWKDSEHFNEKGSAIFSAIVAKQWGY